MALHNAQGWAGEKIDDIKEGTSKALVGMQVGMAEFRDASLEKLTQAKKSIERYIGTKH